MTNWQKFKITDILKELQEGVDFTIENKKKIIFNNEKIVDCLEKQDQGKAKWFYEFIGKFISSAVCFYEEKENGSYVFTFKSGNNKKDSNQKVEKDFKKNTGINITYHGENSNGGHVISGKFKNPEIEKQKNELIEESMGKKQADKSKENLNHHFIDNGNSLTYSTEMINKDSVIKATYHEPRGEEEKNQIIERNKAQREREKDKNSNESKDNKELKDDSKRDKKVENGYSWTQEQFITEINRLKAENKELENNQTLTNSEKENRIKQNQQALDKLESNMFNNSVSDTDSKNANGIGVKGWIGITGGLGLLGLIVAMVIKNKRK